MTKKKQSDEYTLEFQESAVRRAKMPGHTVASVAQDLKIPAWKLRNWVQESKEKLERNSELSELNRLRNELKRKDEEIEILKKAAAYFAKTLQ
jgi:transposase